MSESKYTTLTTVSDLVAAELIKSYLDSEGIAAIIPDEHTANIAWFWRNAIGGVRVQVRSEDAERARPVLQSYYAGASQPDSGRGKGRRSRELTTLKTATLAARTSARVNTTADVYPRSFARARIAYLRS